MKLPVIPDCSSNSYFQQLKDFGKFIEDQCRPSCIFDFAINPNPLWQMVEDRMLEGLDKFSNSRLPEPQVAMLQWYNSGVLLKCEDTVLGFDLLPIPRYYGWADRHGFTARLAEQIDFLMITHNHADHCDSELINLCLEKGRPVFMHPEAALNKAIPVNFLADGESVKVKGVSVKAHHGCHVWRNNPEEVFTTAFEVEFPEGFRAVFCGDLDYTRGLDQVKSFPDLLFITWRNPGPLFEDGHPQQKAKTLDAVNMVVDRLKPERIILQHYAELDHVYKGFSSSYEMAISLIESLSVPTEIYFWGDSTVFKEKSGL
ncbi:MAG: MBL fold metallo-hydrolase [Candidatus Rifleibacteriota bacterium]